MSFQILPQQVQKTILTPTMRQSIEVLLFPILELNTSISQELQNNPLLEIDESALMDQRDSINDALSLSTLEKVLENRRHSLSENSHLEDAFPDDQPLGMTVSLEDKLLRQLHLEFDDPLILKIGEMIIGNLDEDGYLRATCEEIAQGSGLCGIAPVESVLHAIQHFAPAGVAARTLKECLFLQAKAGGAARNNPLILRIIGQHLDDLGKKRFHLIARTLNATPDRVKEAAELIRRFDPRPARNFRELPVNTYIKPDIFIHPAEDGTLKVSLNTHDTPLLKINSVYRRLLHDPKTRPSDREFIKQKLTSALTFIRSIAQRGKTIQRITEYILERQKDFFSQGAAGLVPLGLKDVAAALQHNESTISRAINNKFVDTPHGTFPLKYFFSQKLAGAEAGETVATQSIKEEIKGLIASEDKEKPLSDQEIQEHFRRHNLPLARRTVTKYRQGMRILPSYLRKG